MSKHTLSQLNILKIIMSITINNVIDKQLIYYQAYDNLMCINKSKHILIILDLYRDYHFALLYKWPGTVFYLSRASSTK